MTNSKHNKCEFCFSGWIYAGAYHLRLEIFWEDFLQIQPIDIFQSKQVLVYAKKYLSFWRTLPSQKGIPYQGVKSKGSCSKLAWLQRLTFRFRYLCQFIEGFGRNFGIVIQWVWSNSASLKLNKAPRWKDHIQDSMLCKSESRGIVKDPYKNALLLFCNYIFSEQHYFYAWSREISCCERREALNKNFIF